MQPPIDDQFLAAMGLDGLSEDQKPAALATVLKALDLRMADRVSDQLNEEQLKQLDQLLESGSEDQLSQWFSQNVPNFAQMLEDEAQKMKDEAMGHVQAAQKRSAT